MAGRWQLRGVTAVVTVTVHQLLNRSMELVQVVVLLLEYATVLGGGG